MTFDPIYSSMATIPGREKECANTTESIVSQCDRVVVMRGPLGPDGRTDDARKFFGVNDAPCYRFICDDDLIFPPGCLEWMREWVEEYDRKCVIVLGGGIMNETPVGSYYRGGRRVRYGALNQVDEAVWVNVPLTCGLMYHTDTIQPRLEDFPAHNMGDILFGILCQAEEVPIICLPHKADYITYQDSVGTDTIWDREHSDDPIQTQYTNSIQWNLLTL